jgi:hypothetical protein
MPASLPLHAYSPATRFNPRQACFEKCTVLLFLSCE